MNWRHVTELGLILGVFVLGAYDVLAFRYGGAQATITDVIRDTSALANVVPLALGILGGHLCGQFPVEFIAGWLGGATFWNPAGEQLRAWARSHLTR